MRHTRSMWTAWPIEVGDTCLVVPDAREKWESGRIRNACAIIEGRSTLALGTQRSLCSDLLSIPTVGLRIRHSVYKRTETSAIRKLKALPPTNSRVIGPFITLH
ncbi:hypothetical protein CDAR_115261 [Caerostris darwini]|uniref:Uncharacterized protein n=1 Tax=Caerostris darwini TaxID=1538125 RepID=A0AAV4U9W5_9ARAC|nr:hypothetical protein CDAR_115261 [Caerostris darwini]